MQLLGQNQDTLKFIIKTDEFNLSVIGFKMIENYEKLDINAIGANLEYSFIIFIGKSPVVPIIIGM